MMVTLPLSDLGICAILTKNNNRTELGYYRMNDKLLIKDNNNNINKFNNVDDLFTYQKIAKYVEDEYKLIYFSLGLRCFLDIVNDSKMIQKLNDKCKSKNTSYNIYEIKNNEYLEFFKEIQHLYKK